jgi:hypothetical protein
VSKVGRIGGFMVGAVLLVVLVIHSGPVMLWHTVVGSAWVVGPIVLIWGVVYACNARAWQLLIPDRPPEFTFVRAFLLTISSFAMNFTTPGLSLGGEPLKMSGATPLLGRDRAVGSVVSFRLLHAAAHMLVLLMAIIPAAILLPHTPAILATLASATLVLIGAAAFLLSSHRDGVFERGALLVCKVWPLRGLATRVEQNRGRLQELDRELSAVHTAPGQFKWAVATEVLGRIAATLEIAVILYGLGLGHDMARAFVIGNLTSVFTLLLFFLPFEMGAKEGGTYLTFAWLGFDPKLGTSAALLSRVRELIWAAIGIGVLLLMDPVERRADRKSDS